MSEEQEDKKSSWCPDCKRMIGVGCNCGLSYAEKIKSVGVNRLWAASSHR